MNTPFARISRAAAIAVAIGGIAVAAGCHDFQGDPAPTDALHFPLGLAVHPGGDFLYVLNTNFDGEYRPEVGGSVVVIETETMCIRPNSTVLMPSFGGEIALGHPDADGNPRSLYAASRGGDSLSVLNISADGGALDCAGGDDAADCSITRLPADPYAVHWVDPLTDASACPGSDVDTVVVGSLDSSSVTVLSIHNGNVTGGNVGVVTVGVLDAPDAFATSPVTGEVLVGGRVADGIVALDLVRQCGGGEGDGEVTTLLRSEPTGRIPLALNARTRDMAIGGDGSTLYVSTFNPSTVTVIDLGAGVDAAPVTRAQIDLPTVPGNIALTVEDGQERVYVSLGNDSAIAVLTPSNGAIEQILQVPNGAEPFSIVASLDGSAVYVALFETSQIAVIDTDPLSDAYRSIRVITPQACSQ